MSRFRLGVIAETVIVDADPNEGVRPVDKSERIIAVNSIMGQVAILSGKQKIPAWPVWFSTLSSLVFPLAFSPISQWWLAFIVQIPFFYALAQTSDWKARVGCGLLWGTGHSIAMGYWLFYALVNHYDKTLGLSILFFGLCVALPLALIYGFFALCFHFLYRSGVFFFALAIPSMWILLDFIKEQVPFLIPWGTLGYAAVPLTRFFQIADIVGIYGLTFLLVMINGLICEWVVSHGRRIDLSGAEGSTFTFSFKGFLSQIAGKRALSVMLAIGLPCVYGMVRFDRFQQVAAVSLKTDQALEATLVQGNFSLKDRWSGMGFQHRVGTYLRYSSCDMPVSRHIIVWPETVLNESGKVNDDLFRQIALVIGPRALLVTGGLRRDDAGKGVYNSAYFISGDGRLQWYDKHILLPYAEESPVDGVLGGYYNAPAEFAVGRTPALVETPLATIGASICFESLYPSAVRRTVKAGAGLLINISNDSWFGKSAMPFVHLDSARVRAVENRRFMLRTSNSGISAMISPTGCLLKCSGLFTRESLNGRVAELSGLSFYSRYGDWILIVAVLVLMSSLFGIILRPETETACRENEQGGRNSDPA